VLAAAPYCYDTQSVRSKLHENNAALVGRADNRTIWNLTNLRVVFPGTNIFGLAPIAGKREVLLARRLLRPNYVDSQFLFALLAPTRKVIVWHQSTPVFLAANFTSSIMAAPRPPILPRMKNPATRGGLHGQFELARRKSRAVGRVGSRRYCLRHVIGNTPRGKYIEQQ
jgi:hypothetical protein